MALGSEPFERMAATLVIRNETLKRDTDTVMLNLFQHPGPGRRAGGDLDPETSSG